MKHHCEACCPHALRTSISVGLLLSLALFGWPAWLIADWLVGLAEARGLLDGANGYSRAMVHVAFWLPVFRFIDGKTRSGYRDPDKLRDYP